MHWFQLTVNRSLPWYVQFPWLYNDPCSVRWVSTKTWTPHLDPLLDLLLDLLFFLQKIWVPDLNNWNWSIRWSARFIWSNLRTARELEAQGITVMHCSARYNFCLSDSGSGRKNHPFCLGEGYTWSFSFDCRIGLIFLQYRWLFTIKYSCETSLPKSPSDWVTDEVKLSCHHGGICYLHGLFSTILETKIHCLPNLI